MSKTTKIWLIVASSIILLGLIIFAGAMTILKWDFTKLSTVKYETNNYEINESYKNISIVTNTADIVFVPSEDSKTSVVCYEQKKLQHSITVKDGSLVIEIIDTRKWYEHIGISFGSPKITVYIPTDEYGSLQITSSTGDVEIPKDFKFESIDISQDTGDVINYASASKDIKIKTNTGDINIENIYAYSLDLSVSTGNITASNVTCEGDFKIGVSTGKTKATDIKCKSLISTGNTGDISLKNVIATERFSINRTTGDVTLDSSDANEIFIQTDTGDVTGTLLSEKVFIPKTDTGRINVPNSTTGGRCEITTDTGNIKISIN